MENAARHKWALTQAAFDGLLAALGSDRDLAADRYLEIRRNLVKLFEWRNCSTPEEYADESLNRCARKIGEGEQIRDIGTYCVGVARMLLLEIARDRQKEARSLDEVAEPPTLPNTPEDRSEQRLECLRQCLGQLSPENRDLILNYYDGEKSEKIKNRKGLTQMFGIPANTLRMRALRLRERLQLCSEDCLQQRGAKPA